MKLPKERTDVGSADVGSADVGSVDVDSVDVDSVNVGITFPISPPSGPATPKPVAG